MLSFNLLSSELFNSAVPIIARKKSAFEIADSPGLWRVHWKIDRYIILSTFYTQHDQACLLWAVLTSGIFMMVQFCPISWFTQAAIASVLTLIGSAGMLYLSWRFTALERLVWVLRTWLGLMAVGTILTDLSILHGWGIVLLHICPLWLGLSAIGYFVTGLAMRSRAFILASLLHLLSIWLLAWVGPWQPLTTGLIISGSVWMVAELQWDANGVCGHLVPQKPTALSVQPEKIETAKIYFGLSQDGRQVAEKKLA
jgi:hypothetical protein